MVGLMHSIDSYKSKDRKNIIVAKLAIILMIILIITIFMALFMGSTNLSIVELLTNKSVILIHFRLPRVIMAVLVGSALALTGSVMQSVTKNSLVDTSILGINSAASLFVVLSIGVFNAGTKAVSTNMVFFMPLFSIVGGLLSLIIIYFFTYKDGVSNTKLVLTGVCLSTVYSAITTLISLKLSSNSFDFAMLWLTGTLWGTNFKSMLIVIPFYIILTPIIFYKYNILNLLSLNDEAGISLGLDVKREKFKLIILAAILSSVVVSTVGAIGFIGFVAPHITRKLVGHDYKYIMPITMLIGALILLLCDLLVRTMSNGSEIPVGLIISTIISPYFLYLLIKQR